MKYCFAKYKFDLSQFVSKELVNTRVKPNIILDEALPVVENLDNENSIQSRLNLVKISDEDYEKLCKREKCWDIQINEETSERVVTLVDYVEENK